MKDSKFNTIIEKEEDLLMYNSFSGALLKIPKNKIKDYESILYKEGFLVDDDKDELLTYRYLYYKTLFYNNKLDLTIATTTSCNLSCPYCFEEGNKHKEFIDQDIIDAIIRYIISQKEKKIYITWFGGEPLMCIDKIFDLNNELIKNGIQYHASMITNGTLLTNDIIDKLPLLKLNSIQITIDGEKTEHNQKRFFKNGKGTFDVILSNVTKLLERTSIHVVLKINIDKHNMKSCLSLIESLKKEYNKYINSNQLSITNNSVKNRTDFEDCSQCLSENEYFEFRTKVLHENITIPQLHFACPLRHNGNLMIGPDGSIYKCLEHIGDKFKRIGNIKSHSISISKMAKLALGHDPFDDKECSNCAILPICGGGCPLDRAQKDNGKDISLCPFIKTNLETIIKNTYNTQKDQQV